MRGAHELDLSGLNCPLPVLKQKKSYLRWIRVKGYSLFALTSSFDDFKYFCDHSGNKLVSRERAEDKIFSY